MLGRILKVLLLVALLAALVASSAPAFAGSSRCSCYKDYRIIGPGCHFDSRTLQCVNVSCGGYCA
jgi:hypothetical protein